MFHHLVKRNKKHNYKRIDWDEHVVSCHLKPNGFQKQYHMEEKSENHLVEVLQITVHERLSSASTNGNQPIPPHLVVRCGLRYRGEEHCKSLVEVFGMSETSVQTSIDNSLQQYCNVKNWISNYQQQETSCNNQQTTSYQSLMPVISFVATLIV